MRRIVSREHSSLLEDEERLLFESQFRTGADDPAAPNVLVATPTLEMGIDIGDLSTVVLASLPRTVASYLQRVGRAGRLTGNALNLAFVTGRGEHLPRIGDPLSVINGEVRPPATYLDAEEILQRQYIASVVDRMARTADQQMPGNLSSPLTSAEPGSFLGDLVELAEENADEIVDTFLDAFESLSEESRAVVRAWATPGTDASGNVDRGTSGLAALVYSASQRWKQLDSDLRLPPSGDHRQPGRPARCCGGARSNRRRPARLPFCRGCTALGRQAAEQPPPPVLGRRARGVRAAAELHAHG